MSNEAKVLLGKATIQDAERLRARVDKEGISLALVHNAVTCSTGCSPQLEIWAHPEDVMHIKSILAADWQATAASLGYNTALAEAVYDKDSAVATCPACATVFETKFSECPDCGLHFTAQDEKSASDSSCKSGKGCK